MISIYYNKDFPTKGGAEHDNKLYAVENDVCDNHPTKTNTKYSFLAGTIIFWDVKANCWVEVGSISNRVEFAFYTSRKITELEERIEDLENKS